MDPEALFRSNIELIDRVLDRICRRARLFGADAEDFASTARLALMDDDYAILRRFEGRSSLATFLAVVFEHMLADQQVRRYGKWFASAEATRLGPAGVLLERLLYREGRDLRGASLLVLAAHPGLTAREVEAMAARIPRRSRRPQAVDVESMDELPIAASDSADERAIAGDAQRLSDRAGRTVRGALAAMTPEDRALLRFRFGRGMSIADVSRILRLPQRPLYRRIESLLARLRTELTRAGIDAAGAADIIAAATRPPDFGFDSAETDDRQWTQREPQ